MSLSIKDMFDILSQADTTLEDKINSIRVDAPDDYKEIITTIDIVAALIDPAKDINTVSELTVSNTLTHLLKLISKVTKLTDYSEFNIKFTLINMLYHKYGQNELSDLNIAKYLDKWTATVPQKEAFMLISTMLNILADPSTRVNNRKLVTLDRITNLELFKNVNNNIAIYYNS